MSSKTRSLTLIAALSAANAAFRLALAGGPPNVKPTAFLVIVGGVVGGPITGLVVGLLSIALSDLLSFGAGVWTFYDSGFMAMVGLIAGLLWHHATTLNRWKMAVGGFLLTVVFDIGTSVTDATVFNYPWQVAIAGLYVPFISGSVTPYPFGLAHELTTAVLLAAIGPNLVSRIRKVYS